jgi:lipopolysaccharide transport system permease protein
VIAHLNPIRFGRHLWRHRHLVAQLTRREIESRYRGSALGLLWAFVTPLFLLAVYTFVFGTVFKARWPSRPDAPLAQLSVILFCGLIVFNLFAECLNRAGTLIVSVPNYVKKVVFPIEVLPLVVLGSALFQAAVSLALLVAANLFITHEVPVTLLLAPLVCLPLFAISLGLTWVLSSLGVFLRDVSPVIALLLQALFFTTPVFYPVEAVPPSFRIWLQLNPLTPQIEMFRGVVLWGTLPDWRVYAAWSAGALAIMLAGYAWFMRSKRAFADVL